MKVPITLNIRWTIAARLAVLLAPTLDIMAVTHVPMFVPNSTGKAALIGNIPALANAIKIPVVALEL